MGPNLIAYICHVFRLEILDRLPDFYIILWRAHDFIDNTHQSNNEEIVDYQDIVGTYIIHIFRL